MEMPLTDSSVVGNPNLRLIVFVLIITCIICLGQARPFRLNSVNNASAPSLLVHLGANNSDLKTVPYYAFGNWPSITNKAKGGLSSLVDTRINLPFGLSSGNVSLYSLIMNSTLDGKKVVKLNGPTNPTDISSPPVDRSSSPSSDGGSLAAINLPFYQFKLPFSHIGKSPQHPPAYNRPEAEVTSEELWRNVMKTKVSGIHLPIAHVSSNPRQVKTAVNSAKIVSTWSKLELPLSVMDMPLSAVYLPLAKFVLPLSHIGKVSPGSPFGPHLSPNVIKATMKSKDDVSHIWELGEKTMVRSDEPTNVLNPTFPVADIQKEIGSALSLPQSYLNTPLAFMNLPLSYVNLPFAGFNLPLANLNNPLSLLTTPLAELTTNWARGAAGKINPFTSSDETIIEAPFGPKLKAQENRKHPKQDRLSLKALSLNSNPTPKNIVNLLSGLKLTRKRPEPKLLEKRTKELHAVLDSALLRTAGVGNNNGSLNVSHLSTSVLTTLFRSIPSIPDIGGFVAAPLALLDLPLSLMSLPLTFIDTPYGYVNLPFSHFTLPLSHLALPFNTLGLPTSDIRVPTGNTKDPVVPDVADIPPSLLEAEKSGNSLKAYMNLPLTEMNLPLAVLDLPFELFDLPLSFLNLPLYHITTPFTHLHLPFEQSTLPFGHMSPPFGGLVKPG